MSVHSEIHFNLLDVINKFTSRDSVTVHEKLQTSEEIRQANQILSDSSFWNDCLAASEILVKEGAQVRTIY